MQNQSPLEPLYALEVSGSLLLGECFVCYIRAMAMPKALRMGHGAWGIECIFLELREHREQIWVGFVILWGCYWGIVLQESIQHHTNQGSEVRN